MNDRRTAEAVIHANLMIVVISGGIDQQKYPEMKVLVGLFKETISDLLTSLDQRRGDRLYRRALRDTKAASSSFVLGELASPAKLGLVTFYLLRKLLDIGYIEIHDESPFAVAMEHVLPLLEDLTVEDRLDKSSQKQARHLFDALQRLGYYQGATWSDA